MKYLLLIVFCLLSINSLATEHFLTGSATPTLELIKELTSVFNSEIKDHNVKEILIEGHTDSRGNDKFNMILSDKRATSAVDVLIKLGADKTKISAKGFGETKLLSNGLSLEDHAINRRVIITVKYDVGESISIISEANKECKPLLKEVIIYKEKDMHKNILSLTGTRSQRGLKSSVAGDTATMSNEFDNAIGLMYQRRLNSIYVGGELDTNGGKQISFGFGF
jgi:hypothetical protein